MAVARPEETRQASLRAETIEEIFAALESPLLGYALRLAPERSAAEDIVQEAFMKLHAEFATVREPRAWLYRTVHNLALNQQRAAKRVAPLPESSEEHEKRPDELVDPRPLPDEQIARWEGIGLVRLSLETLDDRSRELIRMKFHDGLSYKEMSARTGLTVGHVGYLLHHALRTIADELARTGGTP